MKKLIFAITMLAGMLAGLHVAAQTNISLGNMLSSNNQLIEDAVRDGILIVRSCYQLQDTTRTTPTFFGRNNMSYFGETFSPAIKSREGYYMGDKASHPWAYDARFEEYNQSSQYAPVRSVRAYRLLDDTTYRSLPYNDDSMREVSARRVYQMQDTVFQQKGFRVDNDNGTKKGWMVWLVAERPLEEQHNQSVSFQISRAELTFEQGTDFYDVKEPTTSKTLLGGYFLMHAATDVGQLEFYLSGILHHKDGKWQAVRLNTVGNAGITPSPSPSPSTEGGLTPIDNVAPDRSRSRSRNR